LVAGEPARVRRDGAELDAFEAHGDVAERALREDVHLAGDLRRRVLVDVAIEFHLRAGSRLRVETGDRSLETGQTHRVVRLDPEIGEVGGSPGNAYRADGRGQRRVRRAHRLARGRGRLLRALRLPRRRCQHLFHVDRLVG